MCERYKNHQYRKLCYESSDAINEFLCAAAINQQIKLNKGGGNTYIKPNVKRKCLAKNWKLLHPGAIKCRQKHATRNIKI